MEAQGDAGEGVEVWEVFQGLDLLLVVSDTHIHVFSQQGKYEVNQCSRN